MRLICVIVGAIAAAIVTEQMHPGRMSELFSSLPF
jgi:hypothetical protein